MAEVTDCCFCPHVSVPEWVVIAIITIDLDNIGNLDFQSTGIFRASPAYYSLTASPMFFNLQIRSS
jgi:hypothetical protein